MISTIYWCAQQRTPEPLIIMGRCRIAHKQRKCSPWLFLKRKKSAMIYWTKWTGCARGISHFLPHFVHFLFHPVFFFSWLRKGGEKTAPGLRWGPGPDWSITLVHRCPEMLAGMGNPVVISFSFDVNCCKVEPCFTFSFLFGERAHHHSSASDIFHKLTTEQSLPLDSKFWDYTA